MWLLKIVNYNNYLEVWNLNFKYFCLCTNFFYYMGTKVLILDLHGLYVWLRLKIICPSFLMFSDFLVLYSRGLWSYVAFEFFWWQAAVIYFKIFHNLFWWTCIVFIIFWVWIDFFECAEKIKIINLINKD